MKRPTGWKQRRVAINKRRGWTHWRKPSRFILSTWMKYPKLFFTPIRLRDTIQPVLPDGTKIEIRSET